MLQVALALQTAMSLSPSFSAAILSLLVIGSFADPDAVLRHARALLKSRKPALVAFAIASIWQPRYKTVRALPGFKDLLREVGLVGYWKKHGWPDRCRAQGEDDFGTAGFWRFGSE